MKLTEEQEKLYFMLESDEVETQDLGLMLCTNGEKENLEVLLQYVTDYSFWTVQPLLRKIVKFEHCKNNLFYSTCIDIANELKPYYEYITNETIVKELNSFIFFFKHIAPKKSLSFYLRK